jgi:hypothetical protein
MMRPAVTNSRCGVKRVVRLLSAVVAAVVLLSAGPVSAEVLLKPDAIQVGASTALPPAQAAGLAGRHLPSIRRSLETLDYAALVAGDTQVQPSRRRSVGRKILGGAIGAVGGLFAGGYLGAKIEGNGCHCDDPGLTGALIGAPIGAIVGGILGATFF